MMSETPLLGVLILAGAFPALVFPFLYAWKSRWWGNQGGRIIMCLSTIIASFYGLLVIYAIWGRDIFIDEAWFDVFRVCAVTFTTVALWYQLVTYIKMAIIEPRKRRRRGESHGGGQC